jgi:predicted peroxiredoxin
MAQTLGICVSHRDCFDRVLGLVKAAKAAGKHVEIFFTGDGVYQSQEPNFTELLGVAKVGICEVSYITNGFKGIDIPGLGDKDFVTQARNAEMVEECDRYVIL